jgi:Tfp pilus assembly protein PilO
MMIFNYRSQYREYRRYIDLLKRRTKSPLIQTSLAVVGTLLLVATLAIVAIRPTAMTISSLWKNVKDEEKTIELLDRKIHSLQIAQQKLEQLESSLALAHRAIPSTPDLPGIARRLEVLAGEHRLILLGFSTRSMLFHREATASASPKASFVASTIPIIVDVGGNESNIRDFLKDLEQMDRVSRIQTVQLTAVPLKSRKELPFPVSGRVQAEFYTSQSISETDQREQKPVAPSGDMESL